MKLFKCGLFSMFVMVLCSCPDYSPHYHYYTKAFYLGEDAIVVSGKALDNNDSLDVHRDVLRDFKRISARTKNADGWEITGTNKGNSEFSLTITTTANGVMLSPETIQTYKGPLMATIEFYLDDEDIFSGGASYREKRETGYDYVYYRYVYVAETADLSETSTEKNSLWWGYTTYHNDLNFSKPGWYKIVYQDPEPIKDNPKHSSGKNTLLFFW